jgi:hypothetical protein
MSDDRPQARVVAPRRFAGDCGCLKRSTVREPYRIWVGLEPLFVRMIADVFFN